MQSRKRGITLQWKEKNYGSTYFLCLFYKSNFMILSLIVKRICNRWMHAHTHACTGPNQYALLNFLEVGGIITAIFSGVRIFRIFTVQIKSQGFHTGKLYELQHNKTDKMTCAPSQPSYQASAQSDQPRHPPSLIRVFAVHSMGS